MFFHWRQHAQVTLYSSGVVITDVALNHLHEFRFAGEALAVIAFPLQNAPESFHRPIVNAVATRDILCVIPACTSLWWNDLLVYWKPLSLWNRGWASGFALTALSKVL